MWLGFSRRLISLPVALISTCPMNSILLAGSVHLRLNQRLCQSKRYCSARPISSYLSHHYTGSFLTLPLPFRQCFESIKQSCNAQLSASSSNPSNEGTIPVLNFEDFVEKDWSFLEIDTSNSEEEHICKTNQIISAAEIGESSRILISAGSEEFVDRVVESSSYDELFIVHDSLFTLACIKEKYDKVKCWQGELIYVPEKWAPFDTVFLYFLPALPFELSEVFGTLAKYCLPGARVVISHLQGRKVLEQQQKDYRDVVVSNLPDKTTLMNVAADHSFKMVEFVDEPDFFLAVLKSEANNAE
ncbi:hypothetical protein Leryth_015365 [Lithospermum erythrorhizon]|nr:hypothetical protein Leryth_015365 [Lithospermum erythrorhizon]